MQHMASWDRPAGLRRVDLGVDSYPALRERLEWKVLGSALLSNYAIKDVSLFVPSSASVEDIGSLGHGGFTHLCDTIVPLRELSSEFLHADDAHCLVFEIPFVSPGDKYLRRAPYQYFCYENAVFRFVDAKYQSVPCELDDILDDLGVYSALAVLTKASFARVRPEDDSRA
jgi:hypothetical protein